MFKNAKPNIAAVALILLAGTYAAAMGGKPAAPFVGFKRDLKQVWLDNIALKRASLLFTRGGNAEEAKVTDAKIAKNTRELADTIGKYYGKDFSDRLHTLLTSRSAGIKDYMKAAFAGNIAGKDAAMDKINKNSEETASFLLSANPYLPKDSFSSLLKAQAGNEISQIDAVALNDSAVEQEIREIMEKNIKILADTLSDAIIRQFPERF